MAVLESPTPQIRKGGVLVKTKASVVSAGTERSKVILAKKSLVGKALARPDQMSKVLMQIRRDGIRGGLQKAFNKLNAYSPLGYSAAGVIVAVSPEIKGLVVGDRVACAGAGYANHAEYIFVPKNLIAPIPPNVGFTDAAFGTVGAIALQGVRQADVHLGDRVAVIGLGLVGLLTIQLLKAAGCVVVGIEPRANRRALALTLGASRVFHPDEVSMGVVRALTDGFGFDETIITAASSSGSLLTLAGEILRDRGRAVIVGDVPIDTPRELFYRKELELRLSRSYGPGRYDRNYEEGGRDYPIGYVRWTEQRNISEILRLLDNRDLNVSSLVTEVLPIDHAITAYERLKDGDILALVLEYPDRDVVERISREVVATGSQRDSKKLLGLSVIGSGSYMGGVMMPVLKTTPNINLRGVLSAGGLSAEDFRNRYGFAFATGHVDDIIDDENAHAVMIATSHSEHARLVHIALAAGKAVYVEKPLALTDEELAQIAGDLESNDQLMVGYNRRFSRHTTLIRRGFESRAGAALVTLRVNAGFIESNHWIHDDAVGGGRIIGEVCHFVDLALFLVGSPIVSVTAEGVGSMDPDHLLEDNLAVVLTHADGSISTILYTAKGDPASGKERIEMFADGIYGEIDDFKTSVLSQNGKTRTVRGSDKGQKTEITDWINAVVSGRAMPISPRDLVLSTSASLAIIKSLRLHEPVKVRTSWT